MGWVSGCFTGGPHTDYKGLTAGQEASALLCRILKQLLSGVTVIVEKLNYLPVLDTEQCSHAQ